MNKRSCWQDRDPRFGEESGRYDKPIPNRDFILQTLGEARQPVGYEALCGLLGVHDRETRAVLTKRLGAMARDGQLLVNRADCFLPHRSLLTVGHRFLVAVATNGLESWEPA